MTIYSVYVKNDQLDNQMIPTDQGFSFTAAIFTVFWALYNKMWSVLIVLIVINSIFGILRMQFEVQNIYASVNIITMLAFGIFATELKEYNLKNKGYELKDLIFATSYEEAEIEFLRRDQT